MRCELKDNWRLAELLKFCINSAIDISIFVGIFRKIMIITIISPAPKYIARFVIASYSSTNANQTSFSFLCPAK